MRQRLKRSVPSVITLVAALSVCSHASAQLVLSSNLVQVGVVVSDSKGPVGGLKAEDFTVFDNGKPRKVRVLLEQSSLTAKLPASRPKNTFSNASSAEGNTPQGQAQTNGTPTIILLDNLNSLYGSAPDGPYEQAPLWMEDHALANAKRRLLAALKEMDLRNPVAAYGLGTKLKMLCDFTCSRDELLNAIKHYDPTDRTNRATSEPGKITIPGQPQMSDAINRDNQHFAAELNARRGQDTIPAIRTIAARASAIPGRKNLLWFTSNLPSSGEAIARIVTPARIAIYPVDGRGLLIPTVVTQGEPLPQLAKGIDTWASQSLQPVGIDEMLDMAADTGGVAFVNTNDIAGAVRSVLDDRSATYTLGFYVDTASVDGKFHKLKIHVNTPDARLRYARGYFAMKNQALMTKQVAYDSQISQSAGAKVITGQDLLVAAVRSPFAASAVPLDVKLERDSDHALHLQGTVGIEGVSLTQNGSVRSGGIVVYMVEQDAAGNVLNRTTNQMQLSLSDQEFADYTKSGLQFNQAIQPQAQTTVLRVVVRDASTSRMGSVIISLANVQ